MSAVSPEDLARLRAKVATFAKYDYHFDVFSDMYGPRSVRQGVYKEIDSDDSAAVVIGIGDYNKTPSEAGMVEIREDFDKHFGEGRWLSTPGNHEVEWVDDKPDNLEWYNAIIGWGEVDYDGEDVAVKVVEGDSFVLLSSAFKTVSENAFIELSARLSAAHESGGRIFVFSHVPCLDSVPKEENDEDHGMKPAVSERFINMMERYGVSAVCSSHQHSSEFWTKNGIMYVGTALGGSPKDEPEDEWGYVRVFVGDVVRFERISLTPSDY